MTSPSSQTDRPGKLWPPPRTAIGTSWPAAARSAATTSAVPAHRAMSAGERSMEPFHTLRRSA
jgi:hypothetical protein